MGYVMAYLTQYSVGTALVSSIKSVLSSSSHALYNLGFNIREFPADSNLSQPSVSMFASTKITTVTKAFKISFLLFTEFKLSGSVLLRVFSIRTNIPVCTFKRFQCRMEQHFPNFLKRGQRNFRKFLTGNFCSLGFSKSPKCSVGWFEFRKS